MTLEEKIELKANKADLELKAGKTATYFTDARVLELDGKIKGLTKDLMLQSTSTTKCKYQHIKIALAYEVTKRNILGNAPKIREVDIIRYFHSTRYKQD